MARFVALVTGPEPALDEAALAIAAGADPDLDPEHWLAELDRLAEGVDSVPELVERLFTDEGYIGDTEDPLDPRNSLLPGVLSRRTGTPTTLAVVCLEVGRRAGIPLEGIAVPGYYLVREPGTERYIDAFTASRLDRTSSEARFRAIAGRSRTPFGPRDLPRASTRDILVRLLEDMREVYRDRGGPADLEWVLRMRLALRHDPEQDSERLVELGEVLGKQGRWDEGAQLITAFLASGTQPEDVTERLQRAAKSLLAHLN